METTLSAVSPHRWAKISFLRMRDASVSGSPLLLPAMRAALVDYSSSGSEGEGEGGGEGAGREKGSGDPGPAPPGGRDLSPPGSR